MILRDSKGTPVLDLPFNVANFVNQRKIPWTFTEKTDIEFRATGSIGGSVALSIDWGFLLVGSGYHNSN